MGEELPKDVLLILRGVLYSCEAWELLKKIQQSKFEDLIGSIKWLMNQAAFHVANRRTL